MEDVTRELALFTLDLKMISISLPHHHDTEIPSPGNKVRPNR